MGYVGGLGRVGGGVRVGKITWFLRGGSELESVESKTKGDGHEAAERVEMDMIRAEAADTDAIIAFAICPCGKTTASMSAILASRQSQRGGEHSGVQRATTRSERQG